MNTVVTCRRQRRGFYVWLRNTAAVLVSLAATLNANHGTGSGRSFLFLEPGFTQEITGVSAHFMGGVAFAPDGDVWVNDCSFSGSHLHRYDIQSTGPEVNGTRLHSETIVSSNAGCGMTNHPDGFIYTNTALGVVQLNAATGAPTGKTVGPPGNALGIAPDPQTDDVVYVAQNCRFTGGCDIVTVDPDTGVSSVFIRLPGFQFIDGIFFNADGSKLFLAKRNPTFSVTVIDRSSPNARTGVFNRDIPLPAEPDGIAFHQTGFLLTANLNGTLSKVVTGPPDTVTLFGSGGFRGDLSQVGADTCLYLTQAGTRYDNGAVTGQNSLVRVCPGFLPPPGVGTTVLAIDEDAIDNGNPPNFYSAASVNDQIAAIGLRAVLPAFSGPNVGKRKVLHTGQVGDEGLFALKSVPDSWKAAGPTADGLRNYLAAGSGLGSQGRRGDREALLDKVPDVTPLRASGLNLLKGRQVCAVVYDSDIGINYGPLNGSLKGANLGVAAFRVLEVRQLHGFSSSSLPRIDIEILDPQSVCEGALTPFLNAPTPVSSSLPFDVVP